MYKCIFINVFDERNKSIHLLDNNYTLKTNEIFNNSYCTSTLLNGKYTGVLAIGPILKVAIWLQKVCRIFQLSTTIVTRIKHIIVPYQIRKLEKAAFTYLKKKPLLSTETF